MNWCFFRKTYISVAKNAENRRKQKDHWGKYQINETSVENILGKLLGQFDSVCWTFVLFLQMPVVEHWPWASWILEQEYEFSLIQQMFHRNCLVVIISCDDLMMQIATSHSLYLRKNISSKLKRRLLLKKFVSPANGKLTVVWMRFLFIIATM